ncbi:hypothetical protein FRC06_005920 [Ceratobasidium sp. 370]|nr:hypothetical protein FRC06_005920 [Ceratobasidium sp. 370]
MASKSVVCKPASVSSAVQSSEPFKVKSLKVYFSPTTQKYAEWPLPPTTDCVTFSQANERYCVKPQALTAQFWLWFQTEQPALSPTISVCRLRNGEKLKKLLCVLGTLNTDGPASRQRLSWSLTKTFSVNQEIWLPSVPFIRFEAMGESTRSTASDQASVPSLPLSVKVPPPPLSSAKPRPSSEDGSVDMVLDVSHSSLDSPVGVLSGDEDMADASVWSIPARESRSKEPAPTKVMGEDWPTILLCLRSVNKSYAEDPTFGQLQKAWIFEKMAHIPRIDEEEYNRLCQSPDAATLACGMLPPFASLEAIRTKGEEWCQLPGWIKDLIKDCTVPVDLVQGGFQA